MCYWAKGVWEGVTLNVALNEVVGNQNKRSHYGWCIYEGNLNFKNLKEAFNGMLVACKTRLGLVLKCFMDTLFSIHKL